jgi:hypothetical protein
VGGQRIRPQRLHLLPNHKTNHKTNQTAHTGIGTALAQHSPVRHGQHRRPEQRLALALGEEAVAQHAAGGRRPAEGVQVPAQRRGAALLVVVGFAATGGSSVASPSPIAIPVADTDTTRLGVIVVVVVVGHEGGGERAV